MNASRHHSSLAIIYQHASTIQQHEPPSNNPVTHQPTKQTSPTSTNLPEPTNLNHMTLAHQPQPTNQPQPINLPTYHPQPAPGTGAPGTPQQGLQVWSPQLAARSWSPISQRRPWASSGSTCAAWASTTSWARWGARGTPVRHVATTRKDREGVDGFFRVSQIGHGMSRGCGSRVSWMTHNQGLGVK